MKKLRLSLLLVCEVKINYNNIMHKGKYSVVHIIVLLNETSLKYSGVKLFVIYAFYIFKKSIITR